MPVYPDRGWAQTARGGVRAKTGTLRSVTVGTAMAQDVTVTFLEDKRLQAAGNEFFSALECCLQISMGCRSPEVQILSPRQFFPIPLIWLGLLSLTGLTIQNRQCGSFRPTPCCGLGQILKFGLRGVS